jgi:hypothetical protein
MNKTKLVKEIQTIRQFKTSPFVNVVKTYGITTRKKEKLQSHLGVITAQ